MHRKAYQVLKDILTSPVRAFILFASLFGMMIIFIMPPFTGADEEAHFVRAYGISRGNFVIQDQEKVEMPVEFRKTIGCLQDKRPVPGEMYTYSYNSYGNEKQKTLTCMNAAGEEKEVYEPVMTSASGYSPLTFIPQVAAIYISDLFKAPIYIADYLVRIAVLAAYILMAGVAIKITPQRKWAMVGILLFPTAILQVSNPGADYMLIGSTAIFIAGILRSRQIDNVKDKVIYRKILALVVLAAVFMIVPKGLFPGICILPALFFFGSIRRDILIKSALAILVLAIGVTWQWFAVSIVNTVSENSTSLTDFPRAFYVTMFTGWANTDFIYSTPRLGIDTKIGMPSIAITVMNFLLAMYMFVDYGESKKKAQRSKEGIFFTASICIIACAIVIGTFAAMYVAASYLQHGDTGIRGVQARYFVPAFLLLAAVPYVRKFASSESTYRTVTIWGSLFILISQTLMLLHMHNWL